jgi:hypothetical protein
MLSHLDGSGLMDLESVDERNPMISYQAADTNLFQTYFISTLIRKGHPNRI